MTNKENLLATGCLILTVFVNGVLLLLNFWSVKANQFYAYAKLRSDQIDKCTHVHATMINQKQNTTKQFITVLITQKSQIGDKVSFSH